LGGLPRPRVTGKKMNKEWFLEKSNGRDLQELHMGIRRGQRCTNPMKLGEKEGENSHVPRRKMAELEAFLLVQISEGCWCCS